MDGCKIKQQKVNSTGIDTQSLLDIHIITEEDIKKRTSWATHITSPYLSVKKIELNKKE